METYELETDKETFEAMVEAQQNVGRLIVTCDDESHANEGLVYYVRYTDESAKEILSID